MFHYLLKKAVISWSRLISTRCFSITLKQLLRHLLLRKKCFEVLDVSHKKWQRGTLLCNSLRHCVWITFICAAALIALCCCAVSEKVIERTVRWGHREHPYASMSGEQKKSNFLSVSLFTKTTLVGPRISYRAFTRTNVAMGRE